MTILEQLSSQVGDRSEASNRQVAVQCLDDPALLLDIERGLGRDDAALVGDCAEIMTMVARERPTEVAPYAVELIPLLNHKKTRVRWETMHALSLIVVYQVPLFLPLLPQIDEMIQKDQSVIVRDGAVDAVGNLAGTSPKAAQLAYPILCRALSAWQGKHAARVLKGLYNVAELVPDHRAEICDLAMAQLEAPKKVTQKAARRLLKAWCEKDLATLLL